MRVDVALLPPHETPDRTCLIVDVLRATSCMAVLTARGLEQIYPAPSVEAARSLRGRLDVRALLCGEVNALPPEGFDFGNSAGEFAEAALGSSTAVMATTNGTPALLACADAPMTMAAAPLNAQACVELALGEGRDVLVVAAGRRGEVAEDDTLAAGLLAARFVEAGATAGEEAARAIEAWEAVRNDLAGAFRSSAHGRDLVALGFDHDLEFCAQTDQFDAVAVLERREADVVLAPRVVAPA
jgi:2-phosphosulfolactate phosphatase